MYKCESFFIPLHTEIQCRYNNDWNHCKAQFRVSPKDR